MFQALLLDERLTEALLERRHSALGFTNEQAAFSAHHRMFRTSQKFRDTFGCQVIPEPWVMRPLVPPSTREDLETLLATPMALRWFTSCCATRRSNLFGA